MKTKIKIELIHFIAKLVITIIGIAIIWLMIFGLSYLCTKMQTGIKVLDTILLSIFITFSISFGIEIFKQLIEQIIDWVFDKIYIWEDSIRAKDILKNKNLWKQKQKLKSG